MRFNNRACALMDIPDLPQGAFEHIGDRKIKPQGGGGGGIPIISDVGNAISDVAQGIGSLGASFEKEVVNPLGGWKVVGPAAAAVVAPYAIGALGGTAAAGSAAAADAAFVAADAAAMAASGLSEAAIAQNLAAAGVNSIAAADAAALAASGIGEAAIAQNLATAYGTSTFGSVPGYSTIADYAAAYPGDEQYIAQDLMEQARSTNVPPGSPTSWDTGAKSFISPSTAIQGARLGLGMLGGQQQPQQAIMQTGGSVNRMPQGAVDYSGIYNLLALQTPSNRNSLLG